MLKWLFFTLWHQPKLISCKIKVAGKWLIFHTVEYQQSKFPIKLPRSVLKTMIPKNMCFYCTCQNERDILSLPLFLTKHIPTITKAAEPNIIIIIIQCRSSLSLVWPWKWWKKKLYCDPIQCPTIIEYYTIYIHMLLPKCALL